VAEDISQSARLFGRRMGEAMQGVCQRKGDRWDILWFGIQMVG